MTDAIKIIKPKKVLPQEVKVKIIKPKKVTTTKKVVKITGRERLAKILIKLPKEGMTIEALSKSSGMDGHTVNSLCSFAMHLSLVKKEGDKYYKI